MDSPEVRALVALVAARQDVVARVGSPAQVLARPFSGNVHLSDKRNGDADLRFVLAGPKGDVDVAVEATFVEGRWTLDDVDLD
jgi:hypothetical protein